MNILVIMSSVNFLTIDVKEIVFVIRRFFYVLRK